MTNDNLIFILILILIYIVIVIVILILIYIADIQDYFEFIIKKHETLTDNLPVQIYANKIKNRIVFKIKNDY